MRTLASAASAASAEAAPAPPRVEGMPNLSREMAKGAGWTVAARLCVRFIGLVSTIVLARLLAPADFGLVALATVFSGALMAFSEFSFDVVLIQNQQAGRDEYDTAWTLSVFRNTVIAACLTLGASTIASFLGDMRLQPVVYWLAAGTFIDGLQNIATVDFRKDLTFHKDFVFMVSSKLGSFLITLPLAFLWRDYWALVVGIVGGAVIRVVASYIMHRYRPRMRLVAWRRIMSFSKWLVANNICVFLFSRSDTFVIGKIVGAGAVGVYGVAFDIASLATSTLLAPLRRAIFPGYAKVADDGESLRHAFVTVFAAVMLVGVPVTMGIGLVADPLVRVMLGPQWVDAIPLIKVLSLYGFLGVVGAGSGPVFLAMGRPQYIAWVYGCSILLMLPLLLFAVGSAGAIGAAWAVTITAAFTVIADFVLISRLLSLSPRRLGQAAWRPVLAGVAMAAAVTELLDVWTIPETSIGWAAVTSAAVSLGAVVYPLVTIALWRIAGRPDGAEQQLIVAASKVYGTVAAKVRWVTGS